jgi:hypothetical protein
MNFRHKGLVFLAAAIFAVIGGYAQTMPLISTTNNNDSWLHIVPIDNAHHDLLPNAVHDLAADLPPGAFILKNQTATAVTVIVAKWAYTDKNGNSQQRNIYCDSYLLSPVDPLINPNDAALVTPDGCVRQEYLSRLRTQKFFGSPLDSVRNKDILKTKDSISAIRISIDSVIFADGQIWGPDSVQYFRTLMQRQVIRQSVADEVAAAKKAGEDVSERLDRIQIDARTKKDKTSSERGYYARLIQKSPNPEGTLRWLQDASLPEFRHIGGQQ